MSSSCRASAASSLFVSTGFTTASSLSTRQLRVVHAREGSKIVQVSSNGVKSNQHEQIDNSESTIERDGSVLNHGHTPSSNDTCDDGNSQEQDRGSEHELQEVIYDESNDDSNEPVDEVSKNVQEATCCLCCSKPTRTAPVYFLICCVVVYINLASSVLFGCLPKHLSYIDLLYMQFITFSTIGFGDSFSMMAEFNSSINIKPGALLAISLVNILVGMAAISTVISYVTETSRVEDARKDLMDKWKEKTCMCASQKKQTTKPR